MAAIWTFSTEGYLWCTISDILYLENDLKMMEIVLTEYQSIHKSFVFFQRVSPVVCEFSSLQISCESDFCKPEFKSCQCIIMSSDQ